MISKKTIFFSLCILLILFSCKKVELNRINKVTTDDVSVLNTDVNAKGTIIDISKEGIAKYGHCWSTNAIPTINDFKTEFEFMRRLPQLYPARVLKPLRTYIEQKIGKDYINSCLIIYKTCNFSEFNIIGSYIYLHDSSKMNICFYDPELNKIPVKQFWSHEKRDILIDQINKLLLL